MLLNGFHYFKSFYRWVCKYQRSIFSDRSTTRDVELVKTTAASGVGQGHDVKVARSNIDEMIEHYAAQTSDASREVGTKQLTASEILQQYTQLTGLNVDDVVNEYTHRVSATHHQGALIGCVAFSVRFVWVFIHVIH